VKCPESSRTSAKSRASARSNRATTLRPASSSGAKVGPIRLAVAGCCGGESRARSTSRSSAPWMMRRQNVASSGCAGWTGRRSPRSARRARRAPGGWSGCTDWPRRCPGRCRPRTSPCPGPAEGCAVRAPSTGICRGSARVLDVAGTESYAQRRARRRHRTGATPTGSPR
jgi:hypothetical protein